MVAILGYSRIQILAAVQTMYSAVADTPDDNFHFPVGASASRRLGYPEALTAHLPGRLLASFAGVGCPFHAEAIRQGDHVLDLGSGAGHDSLIAHRLVGDEGQVIALDLTAAMTRKLHREAAMTGVDDMLVLQGSAEQLPLAESSVDSITSNGMLNLVPDKRRAVAEMFRVLRPGGRLQLADVVIHRPVSVDCHDDPRLWVECVVGATVKEDLLELFEEAGFEEVRVVGRHDYFALSPSEQTREVAESFGAHSVELAMRRGASHPTPWQRWRHRLDPRPCWRRFRRRGLLGLAALALALLSCYGTLALVALLPLLGFGRALHEGAWAGAIATFTLLTLGALAAGIRNRIGPWPSLLGAAGAGLVLYALFVDYHALVELAGFLVLAVATLWDLRRRRRQEARILGLQDGHD